MALLFLVGTPLDAAFANQKGPDFNAFVAFDFKTHILTTQFQFRYIGQFDTMLSHGGKYNASLSAATAARESSMPDRSGSGTVASISFNGIGQFRTDCLSNMVNSRYEHGIRPVNPETSAGRIHYRRALRPHCPDQVEPAFEPFAEFSRSGVFRASQLTH
jgi:hypothetical protein